MRQALSATLSLAALTACTSVPITSMPKLASIDPATTDFSRVELAVRVPVDFRLHRDGTTINVALSPDSEPPLTLELNLQHSEAPLTPFLERQRGDRFNMPRFDIADKDAQRASDYRDLVIATRERLKAEGAGGSASFTIGSTGCLAQGANPFQDLRMKFFIRTRPDQEFYPPIREVRIKSADLSEDGEASVSYCDDNDLPRLIE